MSQTTGSHQAATELHSPPPTKANKSPNYAGATGTVRDLCRKVMPLSPSDTLAHAVEMLRLCPWDSLPMVANGRVLAVVSDADLARLVLADDDPGQARLMPLERALPTLWPIDSRGLAVTFHQDTPLSTARRVFHERPDLSVIPILDDHGLYQGVITSADLLASLCKTLAPPRVGGMATPLGVYLTDGVEAGGAGNAGLFLTGITLSTLYFVALFLAGLVLTGIARWTHVDLNFFYLNFIARHGAGLGPGLLGDLRTGLSLPLMLILLRLMPIAGYHAAEHQVVHCIERGEPLLPQVVRRMPRPHPRCGTNLVAGVTLLSILLVFFTGLAGNLEVGLVAALVTTLSLWRPVGTFLQQYLTTRPASARQIASGIQAGEEILSKYRGRVERQIRLPLRIWRMGILQILAGSMVVLGIMWLLTSLFPALNRLLGGF